MNPHRTVSVGRRLDWSSLDSVAVVRGASTAFSVLVLGGLLHPVLIQVAYPLAYVWLPLVAVVAFAVAGIRAAATTWPPLGGALSALCSYLLVIPLVLMASVGVTLGQMLGTSAVAVVVGAAAAVAARRAPAAGREIRTSKSSTSSRKVGR